MPPINHPKWADLVTGRADYRFANAAASMLLFQLKATVRKDPSPASVAKAVSQIYTFCQKYERMLQKDLETLFN